MASVPRSSAAVLVALALSAAPQPRADEAPDLRVDEWRAAGITFGALALQGVVVATWKPDHCRFCSANDFDEDARDALLWTHHADASRASNVLVVAMPALAAADAVRSTTSWGNAGRDVLVVAEAVSLCTTTTVIAKNAVSRLGPGNPATPGQPTRVYQAFWSGHTAFAFSVAVSQAMQDTMRGDPAAPWIWAVGLTLASGVGYLRIAGDEHWATDVIVGAVVGSAFGVGVPLLEKRLVHGVTLSPAPGGIALRF